MPELAARRVLADEWSVVRAWVDAIPGEDLDRPSVLDGWTVRDLFAHLGPAITVVSYAKPAEAGAVPLTHAQYVTQYPANAAAIADSTRSVAQERRDDLGALLDESWDRVQAWLDELDELDELDGDGRLVVAARRGPIRLTDLIGTRLLELVVHLDDLHRSVPELPAPVHDRAALREVVKLLLGVVAEQAPGRSVEVRVPPFAVVQCVEGPSHSRGTPPNTVETDALTWIRVACGRVSWAEAVADGSVRASGSRADLSGLLPLL